MELLAASKRMNYYLDKRIAGGEILQTNAMHLQNIPTPNAIYSLPRTKTDKDKNEYENDKRMI